MSTIESKRKHNKTAITSHTPRSREDNSKDRSCFILFERSNIKKLKREIEKHDYTSNEESLLPQNTTMKNETVEDRRITTTINNETKATSPRIKITDKNYEIKTPEQKGSIFLN
jgi:hypothetical protein